MKLIALALTFIVVALVATACTETPTNTSTPSTAASPASTASSDVFAAARANYTKHCEACHGPTGEGGLVKVDDKQIKVPSLKAEHAIRHTDDRLIKKIMDGEEAMPAFKDKITPSEIADLVRFIRKEFQGK
jgi:mono/diheme cytochrome c family protein